MKSQTKRALVCSAGLIMSAAAVAYAATTEANAQAKQAIGVLEATPEQAKLASEPLSKAKVALQRAADARQGGDEKHAALLDDLALEWATTASDLVRSAEVESQSAAAEKQAAELEAKAVRALAIIEEAVARKGRAEHELEQHPAPPSAPSAEPPAETAQ